MRPRKGGKHGPGTSPGEPLSQPSASTVSITAENDPAEPSQHAGRSKPAPGLHIVATPIGNAGDISLRALALFRAADTIACEDTRATRRLLALQGVDARLTPYHEHNAVRARPRLLDRLAKGQIVALVSDAGTPLISDPGYKLVREAIAAGHPVTTLPGPSAVLAALTLSGLPTDRFMFAGFLPPRAAARRRMATELRGVRATLVLFESARRLAPSLADLATVLGPRQAVVARELTKFHEEVRRDTLDQLAAHYRAAGAPKGEVVIVIAPPDAGESDTIDDDAVDRLLRAALAEMGTGDAAAQVAAATGRDRRSLYARALALKRPS